MPKKFDRCVKKVRKKSPNVNPYAVCRAAMKKKRKNKKWFKVSEESELARFGYSVKNKSTSRHRALSKAVISTRNSGLEVFHKLWGLANVTQRVQPINSKKYRNDARWVKQKFYSSKYW